jgi:pyridinium-3,5-bisthiocarboxylic acid mononucleotide nickel chelatase
VRVAYFDCVSGISGNMALGGFLDAGATVATLRRTVDALGLGASADVRVEHLTRHDVEATHVEIDVLKPADWANIGAIEAVIRAADLDDGVRERSLLAFRLLAGAEATAHNVAVEHVRLHETGAIDAVIDVVGTFALADELGVEAFYSSALPLTRGSTSSAHGEIPLPAPATMNILQSVGAPTFYRDGDAELVTPTGAAIVGACASFGAAPGIEVQQEGYGAGSAELEWANVLHVVVGQVDPRAALSEPGLVAADKGSGGLQQQLVSVLETNIDDMAPNLLASLPQLMLDAGAVEAFITPVVMKKGRSGQLVTVICDPGEAEAMAVRLVRETSTLGVRVREERRFVAGRRIERMESSLGTVNVKLKIVDGHVIDATPEYEDVRALAAAAGIPLPDAHRQVATEARSRFIEP